MKDTVSRLVGMLVNNSVLIIAPGHAIPSVVMDAQQDVNLNVVDAPTVLDPALDNRTAVDVLAVALREDVLPTVSTIVTRTALDGDVVPSAVLILRGLVKPTAGSTVWERPVPRCVLMRALENVRHASTPADSSVEHVLRCVPQGVVRNVTSLVLRTAPTVVVITVCILVLRNVADVLISATLVWGCVSVCVL